MNSCVIFPKSAADYFARNEATESDVTTIRADQEVRVLVEKLWSVLFDDTAFSAKEALKTIGDKSLSVAKKGDFSAAENLNARYKILALNIHNFAYFVDKGGITAETAKEKIQEAFIQLKELFDETKEVDPAPFQAGEKASPLLLELSRDYVKYICWEDAFLSQKISHDFKAALRSLHDTLFPETLYTMERIAAIEAAATPPASYKEMKFDECIEKRMNFILCLIKSSLKENRELTAEELASIQTSLQEMMKKAELLCKTRMLSEQMKKDEERYKALEELLAPASLGKELSADEKAEKICALEAEVRPFKDLLGRRSDWNKIVKEQYASFTLLELDKEIHKKDITHWKAIEKNSLLFVDFCKALLTHQQQRLERAPQQQSSWWPFNIFG